MKKKKIVLLSIAATLVCGTIAVIAGNGANYSPIDAEATKNKIVLNKDGALTTTEKEAKKFVRSTDGGNSIEFKIVEGFAKTDNDFAKTFDNGRFYNTTPLNGLETIDVACGAKAFRVYYFTSPVDSLEMNYVAFDDCVGVGGSTPISIKVPQFEDPVKYIMWHNKSGANIWLNSIKFNYSCSTSLTNRGSTFDSSGKGVDITPVDVATGTVNVDVKWSDLGSERVKSQSLYSKLVGAQDLDTKIFIKLLRLEIFQD